MKRRLYSGNYADVAEVLQKEFAVTNALASRPVLATCGVGDCVAFAGLERETNRISWTL